jgi:hypothetical protein
MQNKKEWYVSRFEAYNSLFVRRMWNSADVHADVQKADTKLAMPDKVELGLARGC